MFSDGDAAMDAAVSLVLPCARHLRCRFHLESNLRTALHPLLPIIQVEEFITAWKEVIYLAREDDYVAAKEKLERDFPLAMPYLQRYHWVNERSFAECYILDVLTFGLRSTARVESWNALLKGALQVNSSSSLAILFESLQFAASGVDRRRMRRAHDEAARLPPAPPLSYLRRRDAAMAHSLGSHQDTAAVRPAAQLPLRAEDCRRGGLGLVCMGQAICREQRVEEGGQSEGCPHGVYLRLPFIVAAAMPPRVGHQPPPLPPSVSSSSSR